MIAAMVSAGSTSIALFPGYAFSWMRFKGRQGLYVAVVALMIVPVQMAIIPLLSAFGQGVHLASLTVVPAISSPMIQIWLVDAAFGLPLAIFLMKTSVEALPREVIEAARVDGPSDRQLFPHIVVPLATPVIARFAIFQFLWILNDFLVAATFLGVDPAVAPVAVRLADLTGSRAEAQHLPTAGAFVSMAIPLAVFFALQRYFVRGLTAGATKG